MNVQDIRERIDAAVAARGCFLVDVKVSADNDVTLAIESEEGTVVMEDCVAIDKAFHEIWDQDVEDYALTVTSAGLDQPFMVLKQYLKAIGTQVEVRLKGGRKFVAELTAADADAIGLRYTAKEAVEGSKKKVLVEHEETVPMDQVNSVTPYITFD
ncbi:MAG: ribosome assembly cofactor RimP [Bacteroidales bacterium]|nr:ribosome assembly cofactor RimP [Bacteroidales bacterium]